jgi:hypothetical protein
MGLAVSPSTDGWQNHLIIVMNHRYYCDCACNECDYNRDRLEDINALSDINGVGGFVIMID